MKLIKTLALLFMTGLFVVSCQKEYSEENGSGGTATGTLKADGTGECLPSTVQGIYLAGTAVTATNFIDVDVDFTEIGSYLISTDPVNGYTFSAVGLVTSTGVQTIRLKASGTPAVAEANTFTVTFGTSECNIVVDVLPAGTGAATLTLDGAPATCSLARVEGIYKVGTTTDPSHSVTLTVNAITIGTYNITVPASNGIIFIGAGAFATTGPHTITLAANGTPTAAGTNNSIVTVGSSVCTFSVTAVAGGGGGGTPAAVYTLTGAPTQCTGATPAGSYQAQVAMTSANKVTLTVNVMQAGTYSISTLAANGVSFSGAGTFASTGDQPVILTATGLPDMAGPFVFKTTGLTGNSCPFTITFTAAPAPADFTLGDCSGANPAGVYAVNTALGASNTVTISANVVTAGLYSASTNTVNGMSFSVTNAVFSGTGAQTITLVGTGTPTAEGPFDFTVTAGGSTCTFTVTVVGAPSGGIITCKINGTATTFNVDATAILDNSLGVPSLIIFGQTTSAANPAISFGFTKGAGGAIGAGTYTVNQAASGILLGADYTDAGGVEYYAGTDVLNQNPAFEIVIQIINTSRVKGTFKGPLKDNDGAGPGVRTITEGAFDVLF